ncbi:hypothetical protein Dsin_012923 [Dipteronia sinensis]|uniref:Uncharacterized protein n=1 Tax=Dipteronia sinensis TaxID=43782 RepID=A0AAE0AJ02_9ROSI|nr:hypothetical protein Dsin_012923 [Dipteronia sinensis]
MKFVKPLNLYDELFNKTLKKNPSRIFSLVAMNVGEDRVSLAYSRSDSTKAIYLWGYPKPKKNMGVMVNAFKKLIKNLKVEGLIVGYPSFRMKENPDGVETKIFIDNMTKTGNFGGLKYTYWNTRLASKDLLFIVLQEKVAMRYAFCGHHFDNLDQGIEQNLQDSATDILQPNFEDSATNILQMSPMKNVEVTSIFTFGKDT